jgi:hypothetical protein
MLNGSINMVELVLEDQVVEVLNLQLLGILELS